jgi:hypothetical protein
MKEVPYKIRFGANADPNITALTSTTAARWEDVYKFQVPKSMPGVILRTGDIISAYLEAGAAEITRPDAQIAIEYRDAAEMKVVNVFGPENYDAVKELQDKTKRAKLNFRGIPGEEILVKPLEWIVIKIKDDTAMTATDISTNSYGVLECHRLVA